MKWPALYCSWAALAIAASIAIGGLSPENRTRLLVLAFLGLQVPLRSRVATLFASIGPGPRFVLLGTLFAAVVEGFHMISKPVFPSLTVGGGTSFEAAARAYTIDLLYTMPAYVVVFSVIWFFVVRFRYSFWEYVIVMGLGQTLGDGGWVYFLGAPAMLVFLPYPMTNYHAINVLPFLAVADRRGPESRRSPARFLAVPALVATYFACGAVIRVVGARFGFEAG